MTQAEAVLAVGAAIKEVGGLAAIGGMTVKIIHTVPALIATLHPDEKRRRDAKQVVEILRNRKKS